MQRRVCSFLAAFLRQCRADVRGHHPVAAEKPCVLKHLNIRQIAQGIEAEG